MAKIKASQKNENKREESRGDSQLIMALAIPRYLVELLPVLLLILATLWVYWPVHNCEFINLDDAEYVAENPNVLAGLAFQSVIWAFVTTTAANWHPLTWLSHMLDCQLFGLNPGAHHLINLLFHLANTVLLFWLMKNMTGRPWVSTFVAALFALHPLHVESVAWVAERKDVLCTFFWLLTMEAYIRYAKHPNLCRYLLTLLCFVLGLLSKPMLVTLPFVLLLMDYWPLRRFSFDPSGLTSPILRATTGHIQRSMAYRFILEKVPFFALSTASSVVTFYVQKSAGTVGSLETLPIEARLANAIVSYARYIEKMIWPHNLAVLYPYPDMIPLWQVFLAGLFLLGISVLAIRLARSRPYLLVGWLWYLGTLVPVIGLVQVGIQGMADRYTYLPLIGLFILIAMGGSDFLAGWRHRKITLAVSAGLALFFFSVVTRQQVALWQNSIALFEHTLAVTSKNFIIHNNLGNVLELQGEFQVAMSHYSQALRIQPNYAMAHNNLANLLASQGKFQEAAAHYSQALRIKPNYEGAYNNLANLLSRQGKIREAIAFYNQALQINPNYARAHYNLGNLLAEQGNIQAAAAHFHQALRINPNYTKAHYSLGNLLAEQGNIQEAAAHYNRALRSQPDFAEARNNLGTLLAQQGNFQEAIAHYTQALRTNPHYAEAHNNLGNALLQHGEIQDAVSHFNQALRIKPDYTEAYYNLGIVLDQQGKIQEAIAAYSQALRIRPGHAEARNNLGALLAQQGKYKDATLHFSEALRIKPDDADIHENLADTLARQGKIEEAIIHYKKALKLNPELLGAHYSLGNLLIRQGDFQGGISHLTKVIQVRPDWAEARFSLATAYSMIGKPELAKEEYEVLKAVNPDLANTLFRKNK